MCGVKSEKMSKLPTYHFPTCPAVPAFLLTVLGILTVVSVSVLNCAWWQSAAPLCLAAFLFILSLAPAKRLYFIFFITGSVLAFVYLAAPWRTYPEVMPRNVSRMQVRGVVIEPLYSSDELPWLRNKGRFKLKVESMRRFDSEPWSDVHGKVLVKCNKPVKLSYGDYIQFSGVFRPPDKSLYAGGFNYKRYLNGNGIKHIVKAQREDIFRVHSVSGWRLFPYWIFELREKGVEKLTEHIEGNTNKRIAAAVVFGYRDGLTYKLQQRFLNSGAIHLFAISGLHVGIVASIIMLGLRLLQSEYRLRYFLLPLLLGLYVFMTGGATSAIRAWCMISIWSIGKGAYHPVTPLNAVACAGLLLLFTNPLRLLLPGFQFSFVIVSILLLGWRYSSRLIAVLEEKQQWLPLRQRFGGGWLSLSYVRSSVCRLAFGIGLAWLGSAGLVAWTNCLLIPESFFINLTISLIAWVGIFSAVLKVVIGFLGIPFLDPFMGAVVSQILSIIGSLADIGSMSVDSNMIKHPSFAKLGIYYGLLFFALVPAGKARWRLLSLAGAFFILVTIATPEKDKQLTATVFYGDSSAPAVAVQPPVDKSPIIINTGTYKAVRHLTGYLKSRGVSHPRMLILQSADYEASSGASRMIRSQMPETIAVPVETQKNTHVADNLKKYRKKGGKIMTIKDTTKSRQKKRSLNCGNVIVRQSETDAGVRTEVQLDSVAGDKTVTLNCNENGSNELQFIKDGETIKKYRLLKGLKPHIRHYSF